MAIPKGKIRALNIHDAHLGNDLTKAKQVISSFKYIYYKALQSGPIQLLNLPGDVFDKELSMPAMEVREIQLFIAWLLTECANRGTVLRILEGTPRHDRKQSQAFETMAMLLKLDNLDMKYYNKIAIEKHEGLGIDILYVPDEANPSNDTTWLQVNELMEQYGLTKVQVALMHGTMDYQTGGIEGWEYHISDRYLSIVEDFIHLGHVHLSSCHSLPTYSGEITVSGSLERLKHGEEAPKGAYLTTIDRTHGNSKEFLTNDKAVVFTTVDFRDMATEDAVKKLDELNETLVENSHIRYQCYRDESLATELMRLRSRFCNLKLTKQTFKRDSNTTADAVLAKLDNIKGVSVTYENIPHLSFEKLMTRDLSEEKVDYFMATLTELIEECRCG